jgi:hypothetical protein
MIAGRQGSWQTLIADLALILFMVTVAAMHRGSTRAEADPLPQRGEPLAFYRPAEGAPPLRQWLDAQAPDERQALTIVSRYAPGQAAAAASAAVALAAEAGEAGGEARIVIEPSDRSEIVATLAFDRDGNWHTDCKPGSTEGAERASGKESPCA